MRGKQSAGTPASSSASGRGSSGRTGRPCCGPRCRWSPTTASTRSGPRRGRCRARWSRTDDQPTEANDDPGPSWRPATAPWASATYGPGGGSGRATTGPEQRWYGANRWRNHWQGQPGRGRRAAGRSRPPRTCTVAGPRRRPEVAETRRRLRADGRGAASRRRLARRRPGGRVRQRRIPGPELRGPGPAGPPLRDHDWYDDEAGGCPAARAGRRCRPVTAGRR